MAIINIKESYIKENYVPLNDLKKEKLTNQESNLYVNRRYIYKIIKNKFRKDREKCIDKIYQIEFPNAINIVDLLYDNNKFIEIYMKLKKLWKNLLIFINLLYLKKCYIGIFI